MAFLVFATLTSMEDFENVILTDQCLFSLLQIKL